MTSFGGFQVKDPYKDRENKAVDLGIIARSKSELLKLESGFLKKHTENHTVCGRCGRAEMQTVDHIIPRGLLYQFGIDILRFYDEDNLQILCRPCNYLKADRLDFANPRTKPLLLKYLAPL